MHTSTPSESTAYKPAETGCCPRFDPAQVPEKEFVWNDKLFVVEHVHALLHMPLDMTIKVKHASALIAAAGAQPKGRALMLGEEVSAWRSNLYLEATCAVPDAEMVSLSGTFLAKAFQGPFSDSRRWVEEMEDYVESRGHELRRMFFGYTTCPKCARVYGENYVVMYAQVDPSPDVSHG